MTDTNDEPDFEAREHDLHMNDEATVRVRDLDFQCGGNAFGGNWYRAEVLGISDDDLEAVRDSYPAETGSEIVFEVVSQEYGTGLLEVGTRFRLRRFNVSARSDGRVWIEFLDERVEELD